MTEKENQVVAAWKQAAVDLDIQFTSPFTISLPDGTRLECLGLVHRFGRRMGTVIAVIGEPSEPTDPLTTDDYFWSILGESYCEFDRQLFMDTLDDWKFFGPESERPAWYSGRVWGQASDVSGD
jgi:hypothetical protein